jgi:hypothetical protein
MEGYVCIHKFGEKQIFADAKKFRIYVRLHGFMTESFFQNGQSALDAIFAFMSSFGPSHIDYILDMRFSEPWPHDVVRLWKEKTLEVLTQYPQVYSVGITKSDSPLWLQISQWTELFEKHGNRLLGAFETPMEAEAFLDKLRNTGQS